MGSRRLYVRLFQISLVATCASSSAYWGSAWWRPWSATWLPISAAPWESRTPWPRWLSSPSAPAFLVSCLVLARVKTREERPPARPSSRAAPQKSHRGIFYMTESLQAINSSRSQWRAAGPQLALITHASFQTREPCAPPRTSQSRCLPTSRQLVHGFLGRSILPEECKKFHGKRLTPHEAVDVSKKPRRISGERYCGGSYKRVSGGASRTGDYCIQCQKGSRDTENPGIFHRTCALDKARLKTKQRVGDIDETINVSNGGLNHVQQLTVSNNCAEFTVKTTVIPGNRSNQFGGLHGVWKRIVTRGRKNYIHMQRWPLNFKRDTARIISSAIDASSESFSARSKH